MRRCSRLANRSHVFATRVVRVRELWQRRTTIEVAGEQIDLLGLADLITAKKTQRDKDWPMIRRLVEQNYFASAAHPNPEQVDFWLRELRTPELLIEVAGAYPSAASRFARLRPVVHAALARDPSAVASALDEEEQRERSEDRLYWEPLKRELE